MSAYNLHTTSVTRMTFILDMISFLGVIFFFLSIYFYHHNNVNFCTALWILSGLFTIPITGVKAYPVIMKIFQNKIILFLCSLITAILLLLIWPCANSLANKSLVNAFNVSSQNFPYAFNLISALNCLILWLTALGLMFFLLAFIKSVHMGKKKIKLNNNGTYIGIIVCRLKEFYYYIVHFQLLVAFLMLAFGLMVISSWSEEHIDKKQIVAQFLALNLDFTNNDFCANTPKNTLSLLLTYPLNDGKILMAIQQSNRWEYVIEACKKSI
ncbi:MAG: hypothetical protein ACK4PR_01860 [Gammaproteobacteria bacterium]